MTDFPIDTGVGADCGYHGRKAAGDATTRSEDDVAPVRVSLLFAPTVLGDNRWIFVLIDGPTI